MNDKALNVLEQYDLEIKHTWKGRGVWFCETSAGLRVLKEHRSSEEKMQRIYRLLTEMEGIQFFRTDLPVQTKEGKFLSRDEEGTTYLLKVWRESRECDPKSELDVCRGLEGLAIFHEKARGVWEFPSEEQRLCCEGANLETEFEKHTRELKKVQQFIRNRQKKSDFESYYLEIIPRYLESSREIGGCLRESGYEQLRRQAMKAGTICHGEYTQHNVLFERSQLFLTNFEHAHLDIQCMDVALMLRKVMEKQGWRTEQGERFLHAYEVVRPLGDKERYLLALKLLYPEKLWKLANRYYHTGKAWIPERNLQKLKLFVSQQEERERFVQKTLL